MAATASPGPKRRAGGECQGESANQGRSSGRLRGPLQTLQLVRRQSLLAAGALHPSGPLRFGRPRLGRSFCLPRGGGGSSRSRSFGLHGLPGLRHAERLGLWLAGTTGRRNGRGRRRSRWLRLRASDRCQDRDGNEGNGNWPQSRQTITHGKSSLSNPGSREALRRTLSIRSSTAPTNGAASQLTGDQSIDALNDSPSARPDNWISVSRSVSSGIAFTEPSAST